MHGVKETPFSVSYVDERDKNFGNFGNFGNYDDEKGPAYQGRKRIDARETAKVTPYVLRGSPRRHQSLFRCT
jgi:hypothetical protein